MRLRIFRLTDEAQVAFMREHLLKCADVIDQLRSDNQQLRLRGDRLVDALDKNDGTVDSAWKISDAVAAWREYAND